MAEKKTFTGIFTGIKVIFLGTKIRKTENLLIKKK